MMYMQIINVEYGHIERSMNRKVVKNASIKKKDVIVKFKLLRCASNSSFN